MSLLPQQILPETNPIGTVGPQGQVQIDHNWWLLLYNLCQQVLGIGGQPPANILPLIDTILPDALSAQAIGQQIYPITAAEIAAGVTPTNYSYSSISGVDVRRYGAACDGVTDDTAAVQKAINVCGATANWGSLLIPGKCKITSSLIVNRLVQTMESEFIIQGVGPQAGFYVTGSVTIFDSSLSAPTSPQSEFVTFQNIRFESSSQANTAYVMSQKFLRIKFLHCEFYQIYCVTASYFIQSWKFDACLIKAPPPGPPVGFVYAPGSYDISFLDCEVGNYGASAGLLIKIDNADSSGRGCNGLRIIDCLIEGLAGGTAALTGCSGFLMSGNHIESNGATDVNTFVAGLTNNSVSLVGNYVYCPNGPWISHGPTNDVVSIANTVTKAGSVTSGAGELHGGASHITNLASVNDYADGGVSDNAFTYSFGGLSIQGPTAGVSPTTAARVINRRVTLSYSTSINVDASQANSFEITANNNVGFTINAPTNAVDGQYIGFTIYNNAGGTLGTLTWASAYHLAGSWTQPGSANNRSILFEYNGTNWYERSRTAADVPT